LALTEVQAEAILNMRLRSLRRLEEMELVRERDALMEERADLSDLLASDSLQWARVAEQLKDTKKQFGKDYAGGARRSQFAEAAEAEDVPIEAMIEREPITVVCSKMGWIRAMTGHIDLNRELKYKDGDGPAFIFHAETTDRLLVLGSNGRFYTVSCANLPGGRGMGEPLRLMVDLPNEAAIVTMFTYTTGTKLLVASSAGDGFIVPQDDVIAQTRTGKQVLNVKGPEMGRGKGVRLQKYKDGGLSDATTFNLEEGLSWLDPAGRTRTENDLAEWIAKNSQAKNQNARAKHFMFEHAFFESCVRPSGRTQFNDAYPRPFHGTMTFSAQRINMSIANPIAPIKMIPRITTSVCWNFDATMIIPQQTPIATRAPVKISGKLLGTIT